MPKSAKKEVKCEECDKSVLDKDNGLQCEICEHWFHAKCQNITDDAYKLLGQFDAIHWFCSGCNKGLAKIFKTLAGMQEKQVKLEKDVVEIKKDVADIRVEITKIEELAKATDTKLETIIEAKLVEGVERTLKVEVDGRIKNMKEDVAESLEIEKRRGNLVFHGVKEDFGKEETNEDAKQLIDEIIGTALKMDPSRHIESVSRIGKRVVNVADADGKIKFRPIRVKVTSIDSKIEIFKRAVNLKDGAFKGVYITPDLTRKQQKVDKDLRDRVLKFRDDGHKDVKIKAGKIIKNDVGGQVVILYQPPTQA